MWTYSLVAKVGPIVLAALITHHTPTFTSCSGIWRDFLHTNTGIQWDESKLYRYTELVLGLFPKNATEYWISTATIATTSRRQSGRRRLADSLKLHAVSCTTRSDSRYLPDKLRILYKHTQRFFITSGRKQPFKDEEQTTLFKEPVSTAQ